MILALKPSPQAPIYSLLSVFNFFVNSFQINVFMVRFIPMHLSGLYLPLNLVWVLFLMYYLAALL